MAKGVTVNSSLSLYMTAARTHSLVSGKSFLHPKPFCKSPGDRWLGLTAILKVSAPLKMKAVVSSPHCRSGPLGRYLIIQILKFYLRPVV